MYRRLTLPSLPTVLPATRILGGSVMDSTSPGEFLFDRVPFHGELIDVARRFDGELFVFIAPLAKILGANPDTQVGKLREAKWAHTPRLYGINARGQRQEMLAVSAGAARRWLSSLKSHDKLSERQKRLRTLCREELHQAVRLHFSTIANTSENSPISTQERNTGESCSPAELHVIHQRLRALEEEVQALGKEKDEGMADGCKPRGWRLWPWW